MTLFVELHSKRVLWEYSKTKSPEAFAYVSAVPSSLRKSMTQLRWLEIFRSTLFFLQQKGLALHSGNALFLLGNKLIVNCLDFLTAVKFLPITSPENRMGARTFWAAKISPAMLPLARRCTGSQALKAMISLSASLTSEMCGRVPNQLCFPGGFQLFFLPGRWVWPWRDKCTHVHASALEKKRSSFLSTTLERGGKINPLEVKLHGM